jgi:hypothetical protein
MEHASFRAKHVHFASVRRSVQGALRVGAAAASVLARERIEPSFFMRLSRAPDVHEQVNPVNHDQLGRSLYRCRITTPGV